MQMATKQLALFRSVHPGELVIGAPDDALAKRIHSVLDDSGVLNTYPQLDRIMKRLNLSMFGSILLPKAEHGKAFESTIIFCIACILYDDVFENSLVENSSELRNALLCLPFQGETVPAFMHLFASIGQLWSVLKDMPTGLKEQFAEALVDYSESITEETIMISKQSAHPGVSDYLTWREKSSGGRFGPLMAELAYETYLPPQWRMHPAIQRLSVLYNLIIVYQNDYISLKSKRDDGRLNLIYALEREFQFSQETAIMQVFDLHERTVAEFYTQVDEIQEMAKDVPLILAYLDHVKEVLIGATAYHELSARFKQSVNPTWKSLKKTPVPNAMRDQAKTKKYVGTGVWVAGQLLNCLVIYLLSFEGFGNAFVKKVFGVDSHTSFEVRALFILMVSARAASQSLWAIYVAAYAIPVDFAIRVDIFNTAVDTLGVFALLSKREAIDAFDYGLLALFTLGIVLERASEIQRATWKLHPQNKGKPYLSGLFGVAVHINYTGYVLWRFAMLAVTHYWPLYFLLYFIGKNFRGGIRERRAKNLEKYGEDFKRYWEATPKMFPGVY